MKKQIFLLLLLMVFIFGFLGAEEFHDRSYDEIPVLDEPQRQGRHLALPNANFGVDNLVPLHILEKIADAQAYNVWGEVIDRGRPFPVTDENGDVFAYVFPYIHGLPHYPEDNEIFEFIKNLHSRYREHTQAGDRPDLDRMPPEFYTELNHMGSQFGSVYVSARYTNFPVLRTSHFLHPYFLRGELAKEKAMHHFSQNEVNLEKIYFLSPDKEYFEFVSSKGAVLIDVNLLEKKSHKEALTREPAGPIPPNVIRQIEEAWKRNTQLTPEGIDAEDISTTHTEKKIPYYKLIPVVNWTNWCVPTSKAMVLGFYDNFVKGVGTLTGYGRLIDYWFEHPSNGNNVPNIIDEVLPGKDVWKINNYKCTWTETKANASNDWAWTTLKTEIDSGRPAFWSYTGHTMAAFGYRINSTGKYVIVYNTWGTTPTQQLDEYNYALCAGVGSVIPKDGTNGDHLIIWAPDGGKTFNTADPAVITWFVWGTKIKKTTLSYSNDAGNTWIKIASNIPTKGAWNMFTWFPDKSITKARILVQGYTAQNELIAADGSQNNFTITYIKSSGYYNLLHKHSNKYVCTGHTHNGGNIHIWGPIPGGHEDRYNFKFISCGDGYYYIQHKYSSKYVCTGDKHNGGNIHIWGPIPKGHEDRYKFQLIPTLDGYFYILHKYSSKYVCTRDTNNDGNIHIWGPIPSGHENRYKFKINPVP